MTPATKRWAGELAEILRAKGFAGDVDDWCAWLAQLVAEGKPHAASFELVQVYTVCFERWGWQLAARSAYGAVKVLERELAAARAPAGGAR